MSSFPESSSYDADAPNNLELGGHFLASLLMPNPLQKDHPSTETVCKSRKKRPGTKYDQQSRELNKQLRMQGKEYVGERRTPFGLKTVVRKAREIGPSCSSPKCKKSVFSRFCHLFSQQDRLAMFKEFWGLSWELRKAYVRSLVEVTAPKTHKSEAKVPSTFKRQIECKYHLLKDGVRYQVCQSMFMNTLSIKHRSIRLWRNPGPSESSQETSESTSGTQDGERLPSTNKGLAPLLPPQTEAPSNLEVPCDLTVKKSEKRKRKRESSETSQKTQLGEICQGKRLELLSQLSETLQIKQEPAEEGNLWEPEQDMKVQETQLMDLRTSVNNEIKVSSPSNDGESSKDEICSKLTEESPDRPWLQQLQSKLDSQFGGDERHQPDWLPQFREWLDKPDDKGESRKPTEPPTLSEETNLNMGGHFLASLLAPNPQQSEPPEEGRKENRRINDKLFRELNKQLRMQGKEYVGERRTPFGLKTVVRKAREIGPSCSSPKCKKSVFSRFCHLFSQQDRLAMFKEFWGLSWELRKAYVRSLVEVTAPKTHKSEAKVPSTFKRQIECKYHLLKDGVRYQVCQSMFMNTLSIKHRSIRLWRNPGPSESSQETSEGTSGTQDGAQGESSDSDAETGGCQQTNQEEEHWDQVFLPEVQIKTEPSDSEESQEPTWVPQSLDVVAVTEIGAPNTTAVKGSSKPMRDSWNKASSSRDILRDILAESRRPIRLQPTSEPTSSQPIISQEISTNKRFKVCVRIHCDICNKDLLAQSYKNHQKLHAQNFCKKCNKNFDNQNLLKHHIAEEHLKGFKFSCHIPDCNERFSDLNELLNHQAVSHGFSKNTKRKKRSNVKVNTINLQSYKCNKCSFECENSKALANHDHFVHSNIEPDKVQCKMCGEDFISEYFMLLHAKKFHTNWFRCDHCPYKSIYKNKLKKHIQSLHFDHWDLFFE